MLHLRCRMRSSMTYSDGYRDGREAARRGMGLEVIGEAKTSYQRGWLAGYYSVANGDDC